MTYIGLILSIIGSLLIIVTPFTPMLILGRIIQGLSDNYAIYISDY